MKRKSGQLPLNGEGAGRLASLDGKKTLKATPPLEVQGAAQEYAEAVDVKARAADAQKGAEQVLLAALRKHSLPSIVVQLKDGRAERFSAQTGKESIKREPVSVLDHSADEE